jgi:hypothetical protein
MAEQEPIASFVLTPHAVAEIQRRGIDEASVRRVIEAPEQRQVVRLGRHVLQSRSEIGGRWYLIRVFVDVDRNPAEVVTVYRTGKVEKYWRPGDEGEL